MSLCVTTMGARLLTVLSDRIYDIKYSSHMCVLRQVFIRGIGLSIYESGYNYYVFLYINSFLLLYSVSTMSQVNFNISELSIKLTISWSGVFFMSICL